MHGENGVQQLVAAGVLGQIRHRAQAQRAKHILAAFIIRQHDNARVAMLLPYGRDGLESVDAGQAQVHQRHVGQDALVHFQGLFAAFGLRRDGDFEASVQHRTQRHAGQEMVLHQQYF